MFDLKKVLGTNKSLVKKNGYQRKFGSNKNLVQKLRTEKFWVLDLFGHKEIWSKNVFVQKIWSKKSWGPNALGQTELLSKKK